jgi:N-acylneuraminate cytidylyltransferase
MNVALLMGRGGSKSIVNMNVRQTLGRPLVSYPMWAALKAEKIDRVMVTTDCPLIQAVARENGVEVIERPPELSRDDSQMVDGVTHALEVIGEEVEFLVTMHCNCATHGAGLIDACISRLEENPDADACVSGVIDKSVHPFRTRRLTQEGRLEPWFEIPPGTSSNRQALEPCVILDGAARAIRVANCLPPHGNPPFSYLGKNILMVENPGGLDVHDEDDLLHTERFLRDLGWTESAEPISRDA